MSRPQAQIVQHLSRHMRSASSKHSFRAGLSNGPSMTDHLLGGRLFNSSNFGLPRHSSWLPTYRPLQRTQRKCFSTSPRCQGSDPGAVKGGRDWRSRLRQASTDFQRHKTQFIATYGVSALLVHEVLGISSYVIAFALLYSGAIDRGLIEHAITKLGWTSEDLKRRGIELDSPWVTLAMTYPLIKCADMMGLVPLRWFLTFILTPRVSRSIGPALDKMMLRTSSWRTRTFSVSVKSKQSTSGGANLQTKEAPTTRSADVDQTHRLK
eukprot:gb/GEZN01006285.1/.p1 GENE.gb/GEZN01006285.1/~~gb/GEZN01006285.1/.p1  ORF type:complete len:266 (+),score=11.24 gb/GEZN01006285.1/:650-1447(+)